MAALVGVRDAVNYEGQAAIELEQAAARIGSVGYTARVEGGVLYGSDLVRGVVADLGRGVEVPLIAARFHAGLAGLLARAAADACATTGLDTVALSGGVFQNVLLLRLLVAELETAGLRVLTHSRVPPNDAGVSLGQVNTAAGDARWGDRARGQSRSRQVTPTPAIKTTDGALRGAHGPRRAGS